MAMHNRKLVEVALPLASISAAAKADKDNKVATLKNFHKWFAPMPAPALRALIFASLVDDPGTDEERRALLQVVADLVPADGGPPSAAVLRRARKHLPKDTAVIDPFAGGGSTLVEASRLGLDAVGSDLNPVPTLISKTLVEILPLVRTSPANHESALPMAAYEEFLVRLEASMKAVRDRAWQRVCELWPTADDGSVVTAWFWARTVPCLNPACGLTVPLYGSAWLSKRKHAQAYVNFMSDSESDRGSFEVTSAKSASEPTKIGRGKFACPRCGTALSDKDIRRQVLQQKMGLQLMAMQLESGGIRRFVAPKRQPHLENLRDDEHLVELPLVGKAAQSLGAYGLLNHAALWTPRQQRTLRAFAEEIAAEIKGLQAAGRDDDATAIGACLGIVLGKIAQANSTQGRWFMSPATGTGKITPAFGRHDVPMLWDFVEGNPFGGTVGDWMLQLTSIKRALRLLPQDSSPGRVELLDARDAAVLAKGRARTLLVTDPPYFNQISYADLSDFFYVWHRLALRGLFPDLYATAATPKSQELVAQPDRHGGSKAQAGAYFVAGFEDVFNRLGEALSPDLPIVIIYAHRQEGGSDEGESGWSALLEGLMRADYAVVGTWPIWATHSSRQIGIGANALANYIALVCRKRPEGAGPASRRELLATLRSELPAALQALQQGAVAPVDLSQAAIGPGMAVFGRYSKVLEDNGTAMRARTALQIIAQLVDEVLWEQEGELDATSRFCLRWFREFGWDLQPYGKAQDLARATNTDVESLRRGGVFWARAGQARLLGIEELSEDWDPLIDDWVSAWEVVVRLVRALDRDGVDEAGRLMALAKQRVDLDMTKELAYLLFSVCEKKGWTASAALFNGLGTSWPDLASVPSAPRSAAAQQAFDLSSNDEEL